MKKYRMETVVGIFVVIGLTCVCYMALKLGKVSLFGDDSYSLYAKFTSVSGLRINSPVEILGLEVGRVKAMTMDQTNQLAIVEMRVIKGTKVYDDAIASVRTSGLIGDRYVLISPGGGGDLLKPGATIRETEAPLDLVELIGKYAFGDVKDGVKKE